MMQQSQSVFSRNLGFKGFGSPPRVLYDARKQFDDTSSHEGDKGNKAMYNKSTLSSDLELQRIIDSLLPKIIDSRTRNPFALSLCQETDEESLMLTELSKTLTAFSDIGDIDQSSSASLSSVHQVVMIHLSLDKVKHMVAQMFSAIARSQKTKVDLRLDGIDPSITLAFIDLMTTVKFVCEVVQLLQAQSLGLISTALSQLQLSLPPFLYNFICLALPQNHSISLKHELMRYSTKMEVVGDITICPIATIDPAVLTLDLEGMADIFANAYAAELRVPNVKQIKSLCLTVLTSGSNMGTNDWVDKHGNISNDILVKYQHAFSGKDLKYLQFGSNLMTNANSAIKYMSQVHDNFVKRGFPWLPVSMSDVLNNNLRPTISWLLFASLCDDGYLVQSSLQGSEAANIAEIFQVRHLSGSNSSTQSFQRLNYTNPKIEKSLLFGYGTARIWSGIMIGVEVPYRFNGCNYDVTFPRLSPQRILSEKDSPFVNWLTNLVTPTYSGLDKINPIVPASRSIFESLAVDSRVKITPVSYGLLGLRSSSDNIIVSKQTQEHIQGNSRAAAIAKQQHMAKLDALYKDGSIKTSEFQLTIESFIKQRFEFFQALNEVTDASGPDDRVKSSGLKAFSSKISVSKTSSTLAGSSLSGFKSKKTHSNALPNKSSEPNDNSNNNLFILQNKIRIEVDEIQGSNEFIDDSENGRMELKICEEFVRFNGFDNSEYKECNPIIAVGMPMCSGKTFLTDKHPNLFKDIDKLEFSVEQKIGLERELNKDSPNWKEVSRIHSKRIDYEYDKGNLSNKILFVHDYNQLIDVKAAKIFVCDIHISDQHYIEFIVNRLENYAIKDRFLKILEVSAKERKNRRKFSINQRNKILTATLSALLRK